MERLGKQFILVVLAACWLLAAPMSAEAGLVTPSAEQTEVFTGSRISDFLCTRAASVVDFCLFGTRMGVATRLFQDIDAVAVDHIDAASIFFPAADWPEIEALGRSVDATEPFLTGFISNRMLMMGR